MKLKHFGKKAYKQNKKIVRKVNEKQFLYFLKMLLELLFCIKIKKLNNNLCTLKEAELIQIYERKNFPKYFTSDIRYNSITETILNPTMNYFKTPHNTYKWRGKLNYYFLQYSNYIIYNNFKSTTVFSHCTHAYISRL